MEAADFSGYATKAGLKCTDGRTIMKDAFAHQDKMTVPLVWQHGHNEPTNVLGHAILENREDGVYAYGYFNSTPQGQSSKELVQHGDITMLSIWANSLVEKSKQVFHGAIREVSLVLAGANPGAKIDYVAVQHSDGEVEPLTDEAIIYTGLTFQHSAAETEVVEEEVSHADGEEPTVQDVYDSLSEEQKNVVHYMIGAALEAASKTAEHSDDNNTDEGDLTHQEGTDDMSRNVFEQNDGAKAEGHVLTHDAMKGIVADAVKRGSLKEAVEDYALQHGINDMDLLFPDAKNITGAPEFDKRRTEWVAGVLNGVKHSPFSKVKTLWSDITQDEARAKGYIKGNLKKEEWFGVSKRTTGPTTVYKKQKLDRDDILDITDFDVVAWMKGEMRLMLEEELAGAILVGDGRAVDDEDKIKDPIGAAEGTGIRSIANDHELFAATVYVNIDDASSSMNEVVDQIISSRALYKGTGTPTLYTTEYYLTQMLLTRDGQQRRMYRNVAELAAELRVSDIVTVEVLERGGSDLVGIIVNLADYNIGADKGGEVNLFDDFDIDYNQYKYLIETRVSGALTKIRSAIIVRKTAAANVLVAPNKPTFVESTGVVTIPTKTGVVYKNADTNATLTAGAQSALAAGATLNVKAVPAAGYYFSDNVNDEWSFKRPSA